MERREDTTDQVERHRIECMIFERYNSGWAANAITNDLNRLGVSPGPNTTRWHSSRILRVVKRGYL